jgi:hypothetical protein
MAIISTEDRQTLHTLFAQEMQDDVNDRAGAETAIKRGCTAW